MGIDLHAITGGPAILEDLDFCMESFRDVVEKRRVMRLSAYLSDNGESPAEFAARLGVTGEAVRLWIVGERTPRRQMLALIAEKTEGAVTPADFFPEVPSPEQREAL